MPSVVAAVLGYQNRFLTYQVRQQRLQAERLKEINAMFDTLWNHKEALADCGAFEPFFEVANRLLDITEEESEVLEIGVESAKISTREMMEAVKT